MLAVASVTTRLGRNTDDQYSYIIYLWYFALVDFSPELCEGNIATDVLVPL